MLGIMGSALCLSHVVGPETHISRAMADAIDYLTDPIAGSPAVNKNVHGVLCLHVDDLFMAGDNKFMKDIYKRIVTDFSVGSEDMNNIEFVGQRIKWLPKDDEHELSVARFTMLLICQTPFYFLFCP